MIVGIGLDRIAIARMERALARFGARLLARVFTEAEVREALARQPMARRLALCFAAKEAAAKALGTGFREGVAPRMIETVHEPSGKPVLRLHGAALAHAKRLGVREVLVSLTDDGGVAMALAVAVR